MQCPNCHSTRISYNHIPEHIIERVCSVAKAGHSAQWPVVSFGGMALYSAMKAINSLRREWHCDACQATFDA